MPISVLPSTRALSEHAASTPTAAKLFRNVCGFGFELLKVLDGDRKFWREVSLLSCARALMHQRTFRSHKYWMQMKETKERRRSEKI